MMPTITERLADHVVGLRYGDIPEAVVRKTKAQLAHHLGTALRGCQLESGQRAIRIARELSADGHTIIGDRGRVGLLDAVIANSCLMHCTTQDDILLTGWCNPGVIVNPVAWAFGEKVAASGRDLLAAVVVGYDVMDRLGDPALTFGLGAWRPAKYVLAPFGAAATASRLLGLSHEQTVHAFGHAGQVGRNAAGVEGEPDMMYNLLARNGAMAAVLAGAGVVGSPTILEGEHGLIRMFFSRDIPDVVHDRVRTLGKDFAILGAHVRPQPISALSVIPVELTRQLVTQHALEPDRVAAVELTLPDERRAREEMRDEAMMNPQAGPTSRQGSSRFLLASVIADGRLDADRFEPPPDPVLLAVLNKVRLRYEPDRPLLYARVDVTTIDSQHYAAEGETLDPQHVDWGEWLIESGNAIVPEKQLARLVELIDNLERVPDVSALLACVVPTPDA